MTIEQQKEWVADNSDVILKELVLRELVPGISINNSHYSFKVIPLNEEAFYSIYKHYPESLRKRALKLLRPAFSNDNEYLQLKTSTSTYDAWFVCEEVRSIKCNKTKSTGTFMYHVVGKSESGKVRYRNVRAKNMEAAVEAALYSLQYDNKELFDLVSVKGVTNEA